jgi:hypothetical protein
MIYRPVLVGVVAFFCAIAFHWLFWALVVLMYFDARARYKEFLYLRDMEFSEKMCARFGHSWCGRGVCEDVWPEEAYIYYWEHGYRWYHILPDGFPRCFIRLSFWKHVVGVR